MLGVVLLNDTEKLQLESSLIDLAVIFVVLGVTLIFMYAAKPILRVIGDSGASVLSRIMGLILAAVAVDSVLSAVAQFFNIPRRQRRRAAVARPLRAVRAARRRSRRSGTTPIAKMRT